MRSKEAAGAQIRGQTTGNSQLSAEAPSLNSVGDLAENAGMVRPHPPVLFKVERVLGVHQCAFSNRAIIKNFIKRFNCEALDG